MRRIWVAVIPATLALGATRALVAQSNAEASSAAAAYAALVSTPLAGAAPILPALLVGDRVALGWRFSYGQIGDSDFRDRNIMAGLDLPLGGSVLGFDVGWNAPSCSDGFQQFFGDCKGNVLVAANWAAKLVGTSAGPSPAAARFALGVQAGVGYAAPHVSEAFSNVSMSAWALSAGLPLVVTAPIGHVKISPFITPAVGWGRLSASYSGENESWNDLRMMLGGGLQFEFENGLGLNLGLQKVFVDGGNTTFGGGLSWHAR